MAFTDSQVRQLKAKLDPRYVKTRSANGTNLSYVEGWHAIAEANRIFGFDAWDRRTVSTACVWSGQSGQYHAAAYTAKVRVSVRAGEITIVREGSGTGEGRASTPGQAHELALKGAETDATKRALATLATHSGLPSTTESKQGYARRAGSRRPHSNLRRLAPGCCSQHWQAGLKPRQPRAFAGASKQSMSEAHDIELLYDVWEQNIETVRVLHRSTRSDLGSLRLW